MLPVNRRKKMPDITTSPSDPSPTTTASNSVSVIVEAKQQNALRTAINDFLSPKPIVGAGACSAMVLAFTTSLCSAFPVLPGAVVALALSAVFAALIVLSTNGQRVAVKWLYGLICTLMIFNAARGGNTTASEIVSPAAKPAIQAPESVIEIGGDHKVSMSWSLIPCAYADETNTPSAKVRFYFSHWTNGLPVYTNAFGGSYTNKDFKLPTPKSPAQQSPFKKWGWTTKE